MPLYEVLAVLPPQMQRAELAKRMTELGRTVFNAQGVVMDVRSYGIQELGYEVRTNAGQKAREAFMYGMDVAVGEDGLKEVEKVLRFDKEMLRWRIFRKSLRPHFDTRVIQMKDLVQSGNLVDELKRLKGSS